MNTVREVQVRKLFSDYSLSNGEPLLKVAGLRTFYHPDTPHKLYINGETFELPVHCKKAAMALCNCDSVTAADLGSALEDSAFSHVVTQLVNLGYWYADDY